MMTEIEAKEILKNTTKHTRVRDDEIIYSSKYVKAYEMAIKALEKQIPKKPYLKQEGLLGIKMWHCSVCDKAVVSDWNRDLGNNYCHHCGQKLDWE